MTSHTLDDMIVRPMRETDHAVLLALWERSVRATHDFLTEDNVAFFRPLVAEGLRGDALELWVLARAADTPLGFMRLAGDQIEALFLEPDARGRGGALTLDGTGRPFPLLHMRRAAPEPRALRASE